ncbi:hypothetical protein Tco_1466656 [Tanacetum coccineum]
MITADFQENAFFEPFAQLIPHNLPFQVEGGFIVAWVANPPYPYFKFTIIQIAIAHNDVEVGKLTDIEIKAFLLQRKIKTRIIHEEKTLSFAYKERFKTSAPKSCELLSRCIQGDGKLLSTCQAKV